MKVFTVFTARLLSAVAASLDTPLENILFPIRLGATPIILSIIKKSCSPIFLRDLNLISTGSARGNEESWSNRLHIRNHPAGWMKNRDFHLRRRLYSSSKWSLATRVASHDSVTQPGSSSLAVRSRQGCGEWPMPLLPRRDSVSTHFACLPILARAPLVLAHVHTVPAKMGPVFGFWDARGTRRSGGHVATLVGTRAVFA